MELVTLTALVWKITSFLKALTNRRLNEAVTQICVWVAGVVGVWLYASSAWGASVEVGGVALANLSWASVVLAGVSVGSLASSAYDVKRAVDSSDSATEPKLVPHSQA